MTLRRPSPLFSALVAITAFAAALAAMSLLNRRAAPPPPGVVAARLPDAPLPGASTAQRIAGLQRLLHAAPGDPQAATELAAAYLQRIRETGDASLYGRASELLDRARAAAPRDPRTLTVAGTLALARHSFAAALRIGRAAHRAAPLLAAPYPVLVDALTELGRYRAAAAALQRLVDLKPTLAAYARVSYARELHGDVPGAVAAMQLAISAGGDAPESVAYVQTLLGGLELGRGHLGAAARAYELAAARMPGYAPAQAGLARVDAARGRLRPAIRRLRSVVARLPLPEYAVLLGETELAAGRAAAGRRDLRLVAAEERLLRASGVDTDVDLALYEASHGSPERAVALARRAWETAPSVRSADALEWALLRAGRPRAALAWSRRALRLGSVDPMFRLHAGLAAAATGHHAASRRDLSSALADGLRWSPYWAPLARRAMGEER
jgi:tetratricopeptide (TPR) repeat protein